MSAAALSLPAIRCYRKIQSNAADIDPDTGHPIGYSKAKRVTMARWLKVTPRRVLQLFQELREAGAIEMSKVGRRSYPRPLIPCPPPPPLPEPEFTKPAVLASELKPRRRVSPVASPETSSKSSPALPYRSSGSGDVLEAGQQQDTPPEQNPKPSPAPTQVGPVVVGGKERNEEDGRSRYHRPTGTTPRPAKSTGEGVPALPRVGGANAHATSRGRDTDSVACLHHPASDEGTPRRAVDSYLRVAEGRDQRDGMDAGGPGGDRHAAQRLDADPALVADVKAAGVAAPVAVRLAAEAPGECRRQLAWLPERKAKNPPAFFVRAVEGRYGPPAAALPPEPDRPRRYTHAPAGYRLGAGATPAPQRAETLRTGQPGATQATSAGASPLAGLTPRERLAAVRGQAKKEAGNLRIGP